MSSLKKTASTFLIGLGALLATNSLSALILPWAELSSLNSRVQMIGENDLVVIHIDETLVIPKDAILRSYPEALSLRSQYALELQGKAAPEQFVEILGKMLCQRKVELIEEASLSLIEKIQSKARKIIATSSLFSYGPFGDAGFLPDWRHQEMLSLGFDFSTTFPELQQLELSPQASMTGEPLFWKGILFTQNKPHGEVLKQFIETIGVIPRRIIAIDSNKKNLETIEKELRKIGVGVIGLHYTKPNTLPKTLDENVVAFQFKTLIESGKWLSDEEAKEILYTRTLWEGPTTTL